MASSCWPHRQVLVGKLSIFVVTILALLFIPFIPMVCPRDGSLSHIHCKHNKPSHLHHSHPQVSDQLYIFTHKIMSYFAPPIVVIFFLGLCWYRANGLFLTFASTPLPSSIVSFSCINLKFPPRRLFLLLPHFSYMATRCSNFRSCSFVLWLCGWGASLQLGDSVPRCPGKSFRRVLFGVGTLFSFFQYAFPFHPSQLENQLGVLFVKSNFLNFVGVFLLACFTLQVCLGVHYHPLLV